MTDFEFDTAAYLNRIGIAGSVELNLDGLSQVMRRQLQTIPFENFDICLGRGVDLDPKNQFEKLVRNRRGGYCFEINGLFLAAIQSLGFDARPLLARVHGDDIVGGRDHLLPLVSLQGGEWIVDVGFGRDTPHCPLAVELEKPVACGAQLLKFSDGVHLGTLLQQQTDDGWKPLYSFDHEYVGPSDIKFSNHYTATHPDSHFVQHRVAALPIKGGVVTLSDHKLTIRQNGSQREILLPDDDGYLSALREHFGIELDARYEDLKPVAVD